MVRIGESEAEIRWLEIHVTGWWRCAVSRRLWSDTSTHDLCCDQQYVEYGYRSALSLVFHLVLSSVCTAFCHRAEGKWYLASPQASLWGVLSGGMRCREACDDVRLGAPILHEDGGSWLFWIVAKIYAGHGVTFQRTAVFKQNWVKTRLETATPVEQTDDGISTHWLYG
jgi:hypothetical protein